MKYFSQFLNIEKNEGRKFFFLLLIGFFLGIFNVTFLVQNSSSFLDTFDEKVDLPKAIIISGVLGVVAAGLFSFFQNRISFYKIAGFIFILIALVTICIRRGQDYHAYYNRLVFTGFVLITPVAAITSLLFWGIVGRLFSLSQTKKILGSIDSGQLIGTILTSFSIPLVLQFMSKSQDLLIISAVSIGITFILFVFTYRKYPQELKISQEVRLKRKEYKTVNFIKNKYVVAMSSFIIIGMIASLFIDYSFLQVIGKNYPNARDLASFLAKFEGTILVLSFLVQTFVTDKIVGMYGLRVGLLVTPIITLAFTGFASLAGLAVEYGNNLTSFLFFFLAIALSKLFITALKDSLDSPTFKLFFLPFHSSVRLDIQTKIEGVIKLSAGLIAGAMLIGIVSLEVFSVTHISLFLIIILIAWIFITSWMHGKYKDTLQASLSGSQSGNEEYKTEYSIGVLLQQELDGKNYDKMLQTLYLMERIYPLLYEETLNQLIKKGEENLRRLAQDRKEHVLLEDLADLRTFSQLEVHTSETLADLAVLTNEKTNIAEIDPKVLRKLAKSKIESERIWAAKLLRHFAHTDQGILLNELLQDPNSKVVTAAIFTAKHLKKKENWQGVIDLLNDPEHSVLAAAALTEGGDAIIPKLEVAFHKSGQKEHVMSRIIQIYGQMGTPEAINKLWEKINYPNRQLVNQILRAFSYWKIKAEGNQIVNVNNVLESEIRKTAWNIAALTEVGREEFNKHLKQALQEEIDQNLDTVFILLSLIYERHAIQLVKDSIDAGTSEGRVFALELLDLFLAKNLKPMLFPLLDDASEEEKVANLQVQFPREMFDSIEVLKQIINRDYNNISRWTKACAIYSYAFYTDAPVCDDLIANFFNSNILLKETASWAVLRKDERLFDEIIERISHNRNTKNDNILTNLSSSEDGEGKELLRIEKIMFLKNVALFSKVPGDVVAEMVEEFKELRIKSATRHEVKVYAGEEHLYFVYSGHVNILRSTEFIERKEPLSFFETPLTDELNSQEYSLIAEDEAVLLSIKKVTLFQFMAKYYSLAEGFIQVMNKKFSEKSMEVK